MKKNNINTLIFLFIFSLNSILFAQPALSLKNNSYTYLKSNLEFLASDELEGREATTRGEKLASLFISEELEKYGVQPYGDNGTYFQNVPMIVRSFSSESGVVLSDKNGSESIFRNGGDVVYSSRSFPNADYYGKSYEIIFAGYGVSSEEDNYDSYEDINVEGKVVLVINGTPKSEGQQILSMSAIKKFGRSSNEKIKLAKEKGAVGLMLLPDANIIKYWEYISSRATSKSFRLEEEEDLSIPNENIPVLILNNVSAEKLFKNEELDYNSFASEFDSKPASFKLKSKVKFEYEVITKNENARNVIGLIKGRNDKYKGEYLTLGAHYDHEGIRGGKIYNGADDNGSGTVTILEVARQLALTNENERPVLVIFHTAEEKGLKGAKFLTNNSDFIDSTIVHINIDMVGRKSEDSIYCIGANRISSELGRLVEEVNANTTNFFLDYKFDDPNDPQRLYYRSDHVHYANRGIPIVFYYDYMKQDYHKPTDTVDKINFDKLLRMTEYIYNLTIRISNLDHKLTTKELSTN